MNLKVNIEQMLIEGLGFSQRDSQRLTNAFQADLETYLSEADDTSDGFERWLEMALVEGDVPLELGMDAAETGRRLARAVMHQIRRHGGEHLSAATHRTSPGKSIPPIVRSQLEAHLEAMEIEPRPAGPQSGVDSSKTLESQARQAGAEFPSRANVKRASLDLSAVRVHDDPAAAASAQALKARAYTQGRHIFFNRGQYDPGSLQGQRLLAHELAHVVHQVGRRPTTHDTASPETIQRQQQGSEDRVRRSLARRAVRLCQPSDLQKRLVEDWLAPYFRREQTGEVFGVQPPYIYRLDLSNQGWIVPDLHTFIVRGNIEQNSHLDIEVIYRYAGETTDYLVKVAVDLEERDGDVIALAVWWRDVEGQRIEVYRHQARIVSSDEGCRLVPVPFRRPHRLEPDTLTPHEERLRELRRRRFRDRPA